MSGSNLSAFSVQAETRRIHPLSPKAKRLFLAGMVLLLSYFPFSRAYCQEMIFCEKVDKLGNAVNKSTFFTVGKNGGFIQVLIKLPHPVSTHTVVFDVYRIEPESRKEVFDNTFRLDLQAGWTWFNKEVVFHTGEFVLYVYDESDKLMCTGKVTVKEQ